MPHISVVSPIYKAESCVSELCSRLITSLSKITNDFEIILVDDRSPDNSWNLILEESKKDSRIRGLRFTRNFGQHYAITAGLDAADGDWVVVLDCDLQDPPEKINDLYQKAMTGESEVIVALFEGKTEAFHKQWTSKLFWWALSWLSEIKFDPRIGNFRIMSKDVVRNFRIYREQLRFLGGITATMGYSTASVTMTRESRFAGKSSYNLKRQLIVARDIIMAYSDKPLKIFVTFGFLMAFLSMCAGISIMILGLSGHIVVQGWASVMVSLYFIGGIIIGNLGLIGFYLGRIFDEAKRRPLYIVESSTDK